MRCCTFNTPGMLHSSTYRRASLIVNFNIHAAAAVYPWKIRSGNVEINSTIFPKHAFKLREKLSCDLSNKFQASIRSLTIPRNFFWTNSLFNQYLQFTSRNLIAMNLFPLLTTAVTPAFSKPLCPTYQPEISVVKFSGRLNRIRRWHNRELCR